MSAAFSENDFSYRDAAVAHLLVSPRLERAPGVSYDSRFGQWEERASVRRRPRRTFAWDAAAYPFPPELYPPAQHPLVVGRGPAFVRHLLTLRLHDYLDYTTDLENVAVIPVAQKISRGRSGLHLPAQAQSDAFNIVTDEAWHAQFSHEFSLQVARGTGVASPPRREAAPAFTTRLDEVRDALPDMVKGVDSLLFAIVSETLISGMLSKIPQDDRLPSSVRSLVADHAADEGRHHIYFRTILKHLWPVLTTADRSAVGPHVPAMICAFLEPDYQLAFDRLLLVGFDVDEARQVVEQSWPADNVRTEVAEAARPAVRYFAEAGALDDHATAEAFARAGLHPELEPEERA